MGSNPLTIPEHCEAMRALRSKASEASEASEAMEYNVRSASLCSPTMLYFYTIGGLYFYNNLVRNILR